MIRSLIRRFVCNDACRIKCLSDTQSQILKGISELLAQNAALTGRVTKLEDTLTKQVAENAELSKKLLALAGSREQSVRDLHNSG